MGFALDNHPTKCHWLSHDTYILACPAGHSTIPILAEKQALELLPIFITKNYELFLHKQIFLGSDCQSTLVALAQGPLQDYQHSCTKIAWSTTYKTYLHVTDTYDCHFNLQYIPRHVRIQPNEVVDQLAKSYAASFTPEQQSILDTDLTALKSTLYQTLIKHWISSIPLLGAHYHVCGLQCSHLKCWHPLPRALQCLYSWWHVGEVESAGVYPHRLDWIQSPRCHLCVYPSETTVHLLSNCPGMYPTRASLGISFDTLVSETPDSILWIARFDTWLRQLFPIVQSMTDDSLRAILTKALRKRKVPQHPKNPLCPLQKRAKQFLVIPQLNDLPQQRTDVHKRE